MSIFRPFYIFSRSDGQFVAIFPSNFPMTPRSASIHAGALNPARKKKKKFRILFPQNHFIFISLIRMRSKRDIKMGRLCTPGGAVLGIVGGGCDVPFFKW